MEKKPVISLVLSAHLPFVRCFDEKSHHSQTPQALPSYEERWFFEAMSETYIPLLEVFSRLERDHVPFHLGMVFSPVLCHLMSDESLLKKYLAYTEKQIEFGEQELRRTVENPEQYELAKIYYDMAVERRIAFIERYEGNLLKAFDFYQRKGKVEVLTTAASHAFLPLLSGCPESVFAQIEVALASHRAYFSKVSQGFWLPELGWNAELEKYLQSYNFGYTIIESHGLVFGDPAALRGTFYPAKTPSGVFLLGRDFYAAVSLSRIKTSPLYRDNDRDAGYELPLEAISSFLGRNNVRTQTGYKYWNSESEGGRRQIYNPLRAAEQAAKDAERFLDERLSRLETAVSIMEENPVSLCAFKADSFGRHWYEGPQFIEALFRKGADRKDVQFMSPGEYLYKQNSGRFQTVEPELSSSGVNGYSEMWLDASNDWMYRHLVRAQERMTEIAERFTDDTGLKERALNQAAREILLAQASDWPRMLYNQEDTGYAREKIEGSLRNFTTIYEALGSNYISTEWLTNLERKNNIFPNINYRVFRRKK
jgi:1,4-alpha-glucan branching enzyme